jgi:hypothetical protein
MSETQVIDSGRVTEACTDVDDWNAFEVPEGADVVRVRWCQGNDCYPVEDDDWKHRGTTVEVWCPGLNEIIIAWEIVA